MLVFFFGYCFLCQTIFPQQKHILLSEYRETDLQNNGKLKVGLVLSGGGARSLAQIGVLKVFEKYNIPINLIVGNSMGAIVGGLYSAGYSADDLENIVLSTNWSEILSLTDETKRTELFIDQKQSKDRGFLIIRFDGLEPIIPSAVSGGQRVTNFLNKLALQALYHPQPSFDDLKIPFRAVAADIMSGERFIFNKGSLSEAMRASVGVPLMFYPLEKDSLALIDGGVVTNIPVDVAKDEKCNVVLVVNSTSELINLEKHAAPWEVADQIITIMMQNSNQEQMALADLVLKPEIGNQLSSDFSDVKFLIKAGEEIAEKNIQSILSLIEKKSTTNTRDEGLIFTNVLFQFSGDSIPVEIKNKIIASKNHERVTQKDLLEDIDILTSLKIFQDVHVEIVDDSMFHRITYKTKYYPLVKNIIYSGNVNFENTEIDLTFSGLLGKRFNTGQYNLARDQLLHKYRSKGFSLARIESMEVDSKNELLSFIINEGVVNQIHFIGNTHIAEYVLRREFPLKNGDVFQISAAEKGISNLSSLGLFEYVLLEIQNDDKLNPIIVIKVKERATDIIKLGVNANDERWLIFNIDLWDANFRGHGEELGINFLVSNRNRVAEFDYKVRRIFHSYLTFNFKIYHNLQNIFTYQDEPIPASTDWKRVNFGEYRFIKYGGSLSFGTQLERLGNMMLEYRREEHEITEIKTSGVFPEKYPIAIFKVATTIDSKNRMPFPTEGMFLSIAYESAIKGIGSKFSFTKLTLSFENYYTLFSNHTIRPKLFFGVADATLPLAEQYSLGGMNSFFGLREYDSRGRQILLFSGEYRLRFPFKFIYDTFFSFRYDMGMISSLPQEIKLVNMRHATGFQLGFDSPIGPVSAAIGRSFYIPQKIKAPFAKGPWLGYFSIGFDL